MRKKFIKLIKVSGGEILVNPFMISAIEGYPNAENSSLYVLGSDSHFGVAHTPNEIQDMIEDADKLTFTTMGPKKP